MDLAVGATKSVGPATEYGSNNVLACLREDHGMKRTLFAVTVAALALGGIVTASPAAAQPQCLFQGDWDCTGQPKYNGPLQNTWSHGLTQDPQICPGRNTFQPCGLYVPQP